MNTLRVCNIVWVGLLALGGCALMHGAAMGTAPLHSPGQLQLPGGGAGRHVAIAYRAPGGYDEYHRQLGNGGVSEALYLEANGVQTALDFSPYRLQSMTATQWRFNRPPAQLTWKSPHLAPAARGTDHATVTYVRFTRQAPSSPVRHCVAFVRAWDIPGDDPRQRPSRAYFGYHCAPAGQPLSSAAARQYVMRIYTAAHKLPPVHFGDHVPNRPAALARARGTAGKHSYGAPRFPLQRVVNYVDGGHKMN